MAFGESGGSFRAGVNRKSLYDLPKVHKHLEYREYSHVPTYTLTDLNVTKSSDIAMD